METNDCERYRVAVPGLAVTAAALGAVGRTWPVTASRCWDWPLSPCRRCGSRRPRGGPAWLAGLGVMVAPAYLLAADASPTAWVRGLLVAALVAGVPRQPDRRRYGPTGLTPVLCAVTAAGVFAAVPDTEQAAALLGASLPLALRLAAGRGRLGPPGAGAATALLVWVAAVGVGAGALHRRCRRMPGPPGDPARRAVARRPHGTAPHHPPTTVAPPARSSSSTWRSWPWRRGWPASAPTSICVRGGRDLLVALAASVLLAARSS